MKTRWRSLLFVPGDDPRRIGKAVTSGADAVIIDLEDAVPPERKAMARTGIIDAVANARSAGCGLIVRINSRWSEIPSDLATIANAGICAIMVPKVDDASRIAVIDQMWAEIGATPFPPLVALIESPAGLAHIDAIAQMPAVFGLALGSEDFSLALGVPPTPECLDLPCRQIALAAARHDIMSFGMPISITTIEDREAWAVAVGKARAIGLSGALCIHPVQLEPVHHGFAPTDAEVQFAAGAIAAWESAGGRPTTFAGRMIDPPVVAAARRMLEACGRQPTL